MRYDKMTIKTQEALQEATNLVHEHNHQLLEEEHLLLALLRQQDGMVPPLLDRLGINRKELERSAEKSLSSKPQVYGDAAQPQMSGAVARIINGAEKEAAGLKDDFTSTEHLLLAMLASGGPAAELLKKAGVRRDGILQALKALRGSNRVTDQNPENTTQVLEKYCRDLTALARQEKLDPVIGRDEEIRRVM